MNPLTQWILAHPVASWTGLRQTAGYAAVWGNTSVRDWRRALGQAYQFRRAQQALIFAPRNYLVSTVLTGVLAHTGQIMVPVSVTMTDVAGVQRHHVVDVQIDTTMTVAAMQAEFLRRARELAADYNASFDDYYVLPGVYAV